MGVQTKRIYDNVEPEDGHRVLVMTYWPRGVKKEKIDEWARELGTPADLIQQWKEDQISWKDFSEQYLRSIEDDKDKLKELAKLAESKPVTLLCSCKDEEHCHRSLLKQLIEEMRGE